MRSKSGQQDLSLSSILKIKGLVPADVDTIKGGGDGQAEPALHLGDAVDLGLARVEGVGVPESPDGVWGGQLAVVVALGIRPAEEVALLEQDEEAPLLGGLCVLDRLGGLLGILLGLLGLLGGALPDVAEPGGGEQLLGVEGPVLLHLAVRVLGGGEVHADAAMRRVELAEEGEGQEPDLPLVEEEEGAVLAAGLEAGVEGTKQQG